MARDHASVARYDDLADDYDAHFQDAKSLAENRAVARWLRPYVRAAHDIVDLGCGTGLLLDLIPVPPAGYHGVDLSEGMLAHARRKHPAHDFVEGDIEAASIDGIADGRADLIVSLFGSLSYCRLERARDTVARLLAPDGRYCLMFCGPRYPSRRTFIDSGGSGLHVHPSSRILDAYKPDHAHGMSCSIDALPTGTPGWVYDVLIPVECATVGRVAFDLCYFLILAGSRASLV